jgi:hypothetical protein
VRPIRLPEKRSSAHHTYRGSGQLLYKFKVDKGDKQHKDFKEVKHFKIHKSASKYLF